MRNFCSGRNRGLWLLGAWIGLASPAVAEGLDVTAREFQLYMSWKDGREDPRLEKDSEAVRMRKIARSLGIKAAELQDIVNKVGKAAPTIAQETEKAIRHSLDTTILKGRVQEVLIDAEQGHVVAGLKWRCGDARDRDKEAAWGAWAVATGGKIVETLAVWCTDGDGKTIFSAKIARTAFEKIQKSAIERFATSRYIRLFEEPKHGPQDDP